jgi:hypothetical protein
MTKWLVLIGGLVGDMKLLESGQPVLFQGPKGQIYKCNTYAKNPSKYREKHIHLTPPLNSSWIYNTKFGE